MNKIVFVLLVFLLNACAHNNTQFYSNEKIGGEKVVIMETQGKPWETEIEKRLRAKGYKVLANTSTRSDVKAKLELDGSFYTNRRCFAGGYCFAYINANLIDLSKDERIANYSGDGYSENCPPMSGAIFTDIVTMVDAYWQ